ncbi:acyl-CoA dehydrogenase family protein [Protofrankia symbiont of Coriaria ruscifolia]|uniref:acyl-CoA dehydrogenase family protein n=1 Tax=Protofrankia symbiont of Coriaria ruscifolia TaxID=1306542 RepID=UPI001041ABD8|nr:acyl-CoA dehydrogenase family protein [Protofrankia symbiont of Coriaria ruscifolia]
MYFALTEEQQALGDTVRDYLADRFGLKAVRAVFEDSGGDGHPAELWKAAGEQGWLAVLVPKAHDGLGLGLVDAQVVARAFGAGVVPGPWLPTLLAGEAVRLAGSDGHKRALLPRIATGDLVATVALRGPSGRYDSSGVRVAADAAGRLTGSALPVEYAEVAQTVVVAATETPGDVGLYLVDPRSPGVTVSGLDSYDGTVRTASVLLDAVSAQRLPGSSTAVFADLLDRAAVLTAADLVGLAREALVRTVAYDRDRVQFGRPVGSFQALKHHLADLHLAVTMAGHAVLYAAHALDVGLADRRLAVAVAKSKAGDTAREVTGTMIQYHGGIGYTWEHEAHFFYKRAKREVYSYGDPVQHRERVAALTIGAPAALSAPPLF